MVSASYSCYGQRAAIIGLHHICQIQLPVSVLFSKEGMDYIAQNRPGSDLDGLVRVWPNASGQEASWCAGIIGPGFWQDTTSLLPFPTLTQLQSSTDIPDNIVQNQPRSDLVLADCVRFWTNRSGLEASQCARIIQPTSGQCFPAIPPGCKSDPACLLGKNHNL